jgi:dTDP-4-amino-4,6-dideoxygalactose transaminase
MVVGSSAPTAVPLVDLAPAMAELPEEILDACRDILLSGNFIGGSLVEHFEANWAAYCGRRYAVGVANGTDAIELSLRALGIGRGDEVIVPTNTFIATAEAVSRAGAVPVFCDVDDATLLMTAHTVADVLTPRTVAVIAVHLYGQPCDMEALTDFAHSTGLVLIEDAAQAHGASWRARKIGGWGAASCFSFYPTKNLGAAGDAGAVTTNDPWLAARIRALGNHGRSLSDGNRHEMLGGNSRLDALQAALLSAKLPHLDRWTQQRESLIRLYRSRLTDLPGVRLVSEPPPASCAHHLNVVRVRDRERVGQLLARRGIGTAVHYPVPCHLQPVFADPSVSLPVAESAAGELLTLPLFPQLEEARVHDVCNALADAVSVATLVGRRDHRKPTTVGGYAARGRETSNVGRL